MKMSLNGRIIVFFFLLVCYSSYSQTGEEILNKYLNTVSNGDPSKWSRVKSLYATSISYFDVAAFKSKIDFLNSNPPSYKKLYWVLPDQQKEELWGDSSYTESPSHFYFLKDKHVIILKGMPVMVRPVNKSVWFEFYPVRIQQYIKAARKISFNGLKNIPEKTFECFEVVITTRDESYHLYLNPETYLLEALYFPEANIYWLLFEYKEFDGYLMPTQILGARRDGMVYSQQFYKSILFNVPIDANKFDPPK